MTLKHNKRRTAILNAGLVAAKKHGYQNLTGARVAEKANISRGLVQFHFNSMYEFRKALVEYAIEREFIPVIAQAVGALDELTFDIPEELREQALLYIAEGGRDGR